VAKPIDPFDSSPERDPKPLKETLLEWYDSEGVDTNQPALTPDTPVAYDALETLRSMLAARERGEPVNADELNWAREQVKKMPPPQ